MSEFWWLTRWAGAYLDADGPPPTPTYQTVRALCDALGMTVPAPRPEDTEEPRPRSLFDRIRSWWRA